MRKIKLRRLRLPCSTEFIIKLHFIFLTFPLTKLLISVVAFRVSIPDFIPVLGYLDDLIILPALSTLTIKLIPKKKFEECRIKAEGLWKNGKPKKWYYAMPIVIIWVIVILGIVKILI